MIKLKELLEEATISMGQIHSNPYATSFKSPEQIVKERVASPFSQHLRNAQEEVEYMISHGPYPDGDRGVYKDAKGAIKLLQVAQKALSKIK